MGMAVSWRRQHPPRVRVQLVDMRHDDPERNEGVDIQCLGVLTQVRAGASLATRGFISPLAQPVEWEPGMPGHAPSLVVPVPS